MWDIDIASAEDMAKIGVLHVDLETAVLTGELLLMDYPGALHVDACAPHFQTYRV